MIYLIFRQMLWLYGGDFKEMLHVGNSGATLPKYSQSTKIGVFVIFLALLVHILTQIQNMHYVLMYSCI